MAHQCICRKEIIIDSADSPHQLGRAVLLLFLCKDQNADVVENGINQIWDICLLVVHL